MKEQAIQMQALINLRETAIGLVLGRRAHDMLNLSPDGAPADQPALAGPALAAALKAAVNGFKAAAMDEAGRTTTARRPRAS